MANERTMVTRWKSVVDPSVKKAAEEVGDTSDKSSKRSTAAWTAVGTAIGSLAAKGITMLADAAKDFAMDSLRAASDLQQSSGAVEAVFKKDASAIVDSAEQAADGLGLSKSAYQDLATVLGAGLKNKGIQDYADQTQNLVKIGADLAAQYGGSTSDAVGALASLMRGERDPIERYGVTMNEAMVQAEAFALGLAKPAKNLDLIKSAQNKAVLAQRKYNEALKEHGKGSDQALNAEAQLLSAQSRLAKAMEGTTPKLTDQQKAQASLSLLTKQTADAQGAFAREADTAAGAQARMQAKAENLKAAIGTGLLPIQTQFFEILHQKVIPALSDLVERMRAGVTWVSENQAGLKALGITVGVLAGGYTALTIAQKAQAAGSFVSFVRTTITSTKAWSIAQAALNVVMNANPISLVVIAIAALVAGIIYAYNNCKEFRQVVDTSFKAIAAVGKWLWNNALKPVIQALVKGFAWVVDGIAGMLDALGGIPGFEWAKDAANGLHDLAKSARDAADSMEGIPDPKVDTGRSRAEVASLDTQIRSLRGKVVEAKAKGDASEITRLQAKINALKDKKATITAEVEMNKKKDEVIYKAYGSGHLKFTAAANGALLDGLGRQTKRFANGGLEDHTAQFAPAGAMRLWAEPETGGEAYIPLAPAKRSKSIPLWWETGRRLGATSYEDGGIRAGRTGAPVDADVLRHLIAALADLGRQINAGQERMVNELRQARPDPRPAVRLG